MKPVTVRIHQFGNRVAVAFISAEGETVYLDPDQAVATAHTLIRCGDFARRQELRRVASSQRSVIHGSLRPADMVPAFAHELADMTSHEQVVKITGFTPDNAPADGDAFWDTFEAAVILTGLYDALNSVAPEGCYFGAHPGDGSDFGFWMTDEAAEELETLEMKTAGQPFDTCTIPPTPPHTTQEADR